MQRGQSYTTSTPNTLLCFPFDIEGRLYSSTRELRTRALSVCFESVFLSVSERAVFIIAVHSTPTPGVRHSPLVRRQRPPPSRAASYTPLFLFEGANWWYKHAPLLIYILNTSSAALPSTSYPQQTHNSPSAAVAPVLWKVCPTLCLLGHPHGEKNIHQSILSSNIYRNICCVYIQWGNTTGGRNTSAAPSFRILCCLFSSSGSNIIAPTPRHNPGHGQQQISSSSVIYKLYSYSYYTHVYTVGTRCVCGPTCCILDYNQWLLFICYKHSWAKSIACGQPRGAIANRGTVNIKLMIWYMTII